MKRKKDSLLFGKASEPIITTLMEVDTYKFLMMYFIWTYVPLMQVTFAFTNRSIKVKLGDFISLERLKEELSFVRTLRITDNIIEHLRSKGIFSEEFLEDVRSIVLPEPQVAKRADGQLDIMFSGCWYEVTLWETIILAIVNQLYAEKVIGYGDFSQRLVMAEGEKRLRDKIAILEKTDVRFLQFGLRRRLSSWWEEHVTQIALEKMPKNMVAISNVALAKKLGVSWGGTNAHELYSGFYALRSYENKEVAYYAQYEVLEKWRSLYPQNLRIMLPDTFGSGQFLAGLPKDFAESFRGARQDSGDPIVFGRLLLEMYSRFGIDAKSKTLLFSDGLDVGAMVRLQNIFAQRINVLFGWGTNFTNDTGFLQSISIVMKLVEAAGSPAVKLSDNLAKAVGKPEAIARARDIFSYRNTFSEQCVY